ncbi:hypothetical protein [Streptantibioticus silvisoli]|uniref:Uncharacterized protein n=1 Tax=Streptantibioticus silvisoli TaxID=2705255 RepID=A0ABT6WAG7_9ACTN|nr:hypothetical protein [Streptantibioticus silvisoli]MDI5967233.1 hypothetical protein [Streptantibioticus silvisoli]
MPVYPPTDDNVPERPEDQPVPDEVREWFPTGAEGRIRAFAPKDPAARERPPSRRRAPRHPVPVGQRVAAVRRLMTRERLRRPARTLVPAVIGVGVVLLVMSQSAATSGTPGGGRTAPPSVWLTPGTPSGTPTAPDAAAPTAAHPFAGSPAVNWADGAAGIVPPAARAVGGLSRAQVAAALADTKRYIVATELDPATLRGAWPAAAERLMAPASGWSDAVRTDIARPRAGHNPLSYLTRYQPSRIAPAGPTVKVKGTMTFAGAARGSVEVRTDYTFVHPFVQAHGGDGQVSRSIVRQVLVMRVYPARLSGDAPGKLWLQNTFADDFNTSCGVGDGYLHPGFGTGAAARPGSGRTADPYAVGVPVGALPKTCATTTRT